MESVTAKPGKLKWSDLVGKEVKRSFLENKGFQRGLGERWRKKKIGVGGGNRTRLTL